MTAAEWIALCGVVLTVLSGGGAGLWWLSSMLAEFRVMIGMFRDELASFRKDREAIAKIPEHERRLGILEEMLRDVSHGLNRRVARLEGRSNPEITLEEE